jgi:mannose-1-phosphate guanylyltransferase
VAVFPSDHFILEEDRFIDHVSLAVRAVHHDPSQLVLLAMEAQWPETEYGYVIAAENNGQIDMSGCRKAAHFIEKPDPAEAHLPVAAGAQWNTMIMVFRGATLLSHIQALYSHIAILFRGLSAVIGTPAEKGKIQEIYRSLPPLNFSKDILEKIAARFPAAISVLPVFQVTWSDWGSPQRLADTKRALERRTHSATHLQQSPFPARSHPSPKSSVAALVHRHRQLRQP